MKKARLLTLVMAIVMIAMSPMKMWAISGSGTSSDPYKIGSATDWKNSTFQSKLSSSSSSNKVYIKLTADITLTSVTLRDNEVYIVLDGQGHTISLTGVTTSDENTGLFGKIGGGEVKNLHLGGNLTTSKKYMGNLCGKVTGTLTITNVLCSASLANTTEGDATAGGFIGQINGDVTFNNCGYTYKFYGKGKSNQICGMVGYRSKGTVVFNNCFCKAVWDNVPSGDNYAYMRNDGSSTTYNNCYYVTYGTGGKATDKSSGGPTQIADSKFATGELAYKLNDYTSGWSGWYQNLSGTKDGYPFPYNTTASTHAKVYYGYDHGATSQTYNNSIYTRSAKHEYYTSCTASWSNSGTPDSCKVALSYWCSSCTGKGSEELTPTCVITYPTCTEEGSYFYTATSTTYKKDASNYYSFSKTHLLNNLPHDFSITSEDSTYLKSPATCTTDAVYYYKCSQCAKKSTTTWTKTGTATGHHFILERKDDIYLVTPPTCTTSAVYYKSCSGCTEKGTETWTDPGPALGHDYRDSWSWADDCRNATCILTCKRCNDQLTLNKTTNPAVTITRTITKNPTTTESGEHTYKASVTYSGKTYNAPDKVLADFETHVFASTDLTRDVCTECGHGFFRYSSRNNVVVTPNNADNLRGADGKKLEIIGNEYLSTEGKCVIEFDRALVCIGDSAFCNCKDFTDRLTIPNSVTSIGNAAFYGCVNITGNLTIPNSVTSINKLTFRGLKNITSVTIPNSVTYIGPSVFANCSALTSVTIPNSVTQIEEHTFAYCSALTSVTIPNSVTQIAISSFSSCSALTSVTIPNSVTSIGSAAFKNCSKLKSVTFNSIPNVDETAFGSTANPLNISTFTLALSDSSYVARNKDSFPTLTSKPTYTRSIAATSNWGTVILPFEAKSDDKVQLYKLTSVSGSSLTLSPVETVAANTPCIFKKKVANATSVTFTANSVDVADAVATEPAAVDGLSIRGTYTAADVTAGAGYMLDADKFVKNTTKTTLSPFRAYLAGAINGVSTLYLPGTFTYGDLNADGSFTIEDLTLLVEILNSNGTITNPAADVNGQNGVTVDDVNALGNKILGK